MSQSEAASAPVLTNVGTAYTNSVNGATTTALYAIHYARDAITVQRM